VTSVGGANCATIGVVSGLGLGALTMHAGAGIADAGAGWSMGEMTVRYSGLGFCSCGPAAQATSHESDCSGRVVVVAQQACAGRHNSATVSLRAASAMTAISKAVMRARRIGRSFGFLTLTLTRVACRREHCQHFRHRRVVDTIATTSLVACRMT